MFDTEFADASDDELVAAIEDGVRQEAMAGARRLAAIAELTRRRDKPDDERRKWGFDPWASACAEVGAAMAVGRRRASGQMRIAQALREHLPCVAAQYWKGALSTRLVSAITWGTQLVDGEQAWANIDAAIAERAVKWERLSEEKLRDVIDFEVDRFDPDAHKRTESNMRGRDFTVGACDDEAETVSVFGQLLTPDAVVLRERIAAMVKGLCQEDPRSAGERRSDAAAAIANGNTTLACRCGRSDCPTAAVAPESHVVIHMIADQTAIDEASAEKARTSDPIKRPSTPALLLGQGALPNALLAEAIRNGAVIKPIRTPESGGESGYRPSAALAEFVRMRDLFCRFPGCDVPADRCDIDHVRPWPLGPTHPSNLNCKCRAHHLMKTFWTGADGWSDQQLPDATVIWTAPSGRTYRTQPGCRLFFPAWNVTTAELPPPTAQPPPSAHRGLMMPRRKRPRAEDIAAAIRAERELNRRDVAPF